MPSSLDIATLQDGVQLNEGIVNFGIYTLGRKYIDRRCLFLNSYLASKLQQGELCEWLRHGNLADYDSIIAPIHDLGLSHWRVAYIWRDAVEDTQPAPAAPNHGFMMVVLDPLGYGGQQLNAPQSGLETFLERYGIRTRVLPPPVDLPTQRDNHSCGLHILSYVEHILANVEAFKHAAKTRASANWPPVDFGKERLRWLAAAKMAGRQVTRARKAVDSGQLNRGHGRSGDRVSLFSNIGMSLPPARAIFLSCTAANSLQSTALSRTIASSLPWGRSTKATEAPALIMALAHSSFRKTACRRF